jgi:hypothetical protein
MANLRAIFYGSVNFHRKFDRGFRIVEEHQHHSIPRRNAGESSFGFRAPEPLRFSHNQRQLSNDPALLSNEQCGVTDHVHHQDVRDLQLEIRFSFGSHTTTAPRSLPQTSYKIDINSAAANCPVAAEV